MSLFSRGPERALTAARPRDGETATAGRFFRIGNFYRRAIWGGASALVVQQAPDLVVDRDIPGVALLHIVEDDVRRGILPGGAKVGCLGRILAGQDFGEGFYHLLKKAAGQRHLE